MTVRAVAWLFYADEHQRRLPSVFYYHSKQLNVGQGDANNNAWVRGSTLVWVARGTRPSQSATLPTGSDAA